MTYHGALSEEDDRPEVKEHGDRPERPHTPSTKTPGPGSHWS